MELVVRKFLCGRIVGIVRTTAGIELAYTLPQTDRDSAARAAMRLSLKIN